MTITRYDRKLVESSHQFLAAAGAAPASRQLLENYGFSADEQARGHRLVHDSERAFAAEAAGTAWNFLSPTPERRAAEAHAWYRDRRRRWWQQWFRAADVTEAVRHGLAAPAALRRARAALALDLARARGSRPTDAPPPKDTVLVELSGWYERWKLLALRVFRERPDLLAPFGLVAGRAAPRLRNKEAQVKYGERAAGTRISLPVVGTSAAEH